MLRSPLNVIPAFLMVALNSLVSLRRLEAFLTEEEVDDAVSSLKAHDAAGSGVRSAIASEESDDHELPLGFEGPARFMWNQASSSRGSATPQFCLEVPSIDFPPGALTVVTGRIAAGKSMLLHALLGELRCSSGTLRLPKFSGGVSRISFAGQTPWLQAGKSIRDNICFVTDYDAARYRLIVDACALRLDIDALEDGDDTQIARDTLSGGQRARVCLARALYARSHTVILDDVLSAVDAKVQQHLVQHALLAKEVTGGRRIIIATHHPKLLEEHAAMMLTLHDGKVVNVARQAAPLEVASSLGTDAGPSTSASSAGSTASDGLKDAAARPAPQEDAVQPKSARLLYQLEGRRQGAVAWGLFSVYARASSSVPWLAILLLTILFRVAIGSEQGWLKWWGEASRQHVPKRVVSWLPSLPPAEGHERFYLLGYAVIGIAMIVLGESQTDLRRRTLLTLPSVLIKQLVFYFATLAASRRLFRTLFTNLVRAPMSWYDANPLGRVIQVGRPPDQKTDVCKADDLCAALGCRLLCRRHRSPRLKPHALQRPVGPRDVSAALCAHRAVVSAAVCAATRVRSALRTRLPGRHAGHAAHREHE
jgi:ABC-type multidrug transport system fused ATPase/permease subunit